MALQLLILSVSGFEANLTCSAYTCKEKSQIFNNDTCVYYEKDSNKFYASDCPDDYICEISQTSNSTCKLKSKYSYSKFPGEKCDISEDCSENAVNGCINKTCQGKSQNELCSSHADCNPSLRCYNSSCTPQIQGGESGCTTDYDCVNFAGCLQGQCVLYFSIPQYSQISECNYFRSNFCASGMCQGNYCVSQQQTSGDIPKKCKDDLDCFTDKQAFGTCNCGLNTKMNKFCGLFPGDPDYKRYLSLLYEWQNTYNILKCNTLRRDNSDCVKDYWDKENAIAFKYFQLKILNFAQIASLDSCVGDLYLDVYFQSQEAYDSGILLNLLLQSIFIGIII